MISLHGIKAVAFYLTLGLIHCGIATAQPQEIIPTRTEPFRDEPVDLLTNPRCVTPAQALATAIVYADQNPKEALFRRFVLLRDSSQSIAFDTYMNMIWNRSGIPWISQKIPIDNKAVLGIVNFLTLAKNDEDITRMSGVWERLQEDEPFWLLNGPKIEIKPERRFAKAISPNQSLFDKNVKVGVLEEGKEYEILSEQEIGNVRWVTLSSLGKRGVIKASEVTIRTESTKKLIEARGINPYYGADAAKLTLATRSNVPIVEFGHLAYKGTWNINGGLYYEFRDIRPAPSGSGLTDFAFVLQQFAGIDLKVTEQLGSDMKSLIVRSKVTGKPRAGVFLTGSQVRPDFGIGAVSFTQDGSDEDRDAINDPFRSPLDNKFKATEGLIQTSTAVIAILTDGEGKLQRSAPDNIVADHSISPPHTRRLNGWISCARCHTGNFTITQEEASLAGVSTGNSTNDLTKDLIVEEAFWKPFPNHMLTILSSGFDIFGDKRDQFPKTTTVNRLAQLYSGDFTIPLMRARMDLNGLAYRIGRANGLPKPLSANAAIQSVVKAADEYLLDIVTPVKACEELGFIAKDSKQAVRILRTLIPPLPPDQFGLRNEDPNAILMLSGLGLGRREWNQVYADFAIRSLATLSALQKPNGIDEPIEPKQDMKKGDGQDKG